MSHNLKTEKHFLRQSNNSGAKSSLRVNWGFIGVWLHELNHFCQLYARAFSTAHKSCLYLFLAMHPARHVGSVNQPRGDNIYTMAIGIRYKQGLLLLESWLLKHLPAYHQLASTMESLSWINFPSYKNGENYTHRLPHWDTESFCELGRKSILY